MVSFKKVHFSSKKEKLVLNDGYLV